MLTQRQRWRRAGAPRQRPSEAVRELAERHGAPGFVAAFVTQRWWRKHNSAADIHDQRDAALSTVSTTVVAKKMISRSASQRPAAPLSSPLSSPSSSPAPRYGRERSASQPVFSTPPLVPGISGGLLKDKAVLAEVKHVGFSDTVQVVLIPQFPPNEAYRKTMWWGTETFIANAKEVLAEQDAKAAEEKLLAKEADLLPHAPLKEICAA